MDITTFGNHHTKVFVVISYINQDHQVVRGETFTCRTYMSIYITIADYEISNLVVSIYQTSLTTSFWYLSTNTAVICHNYIVTIMVRQSPLTTKAVTS